MRRALPGLIGMAGLWDVAHVIASGPRPRPPSRLYKPNGERECARRRKQHAAWNQMWSHRLPDREPCVWPRHLGDKAEFVAAVNAEEIALANKEVDV